VSPAQRSLNRCTDYVRFTLIKTNQISSAAYGQSVKTVVYTVYGTLPLLQYLFVHTTVRCIILFQSPGFDGCRSCDGNLSQPNFFRLARLHFGMVVDAADHPRFVIVLRDDALTNPLLQLTEIDRFLGIGFIKATIFRQLDHIGKVRTIQFVPFSIGLIFSYCAIADNSTPHRWQLRRITQK
jgi:hypothetical protein